MITLSYSNVSISLQFPNIGYESTIKFPFDIVQLDTGLNYIRDEGTAYDKRTCNAEFLLNEDEQKTLNDFIKDASRGQAVTMTLQSDCGFFPFGPDLGDTGDWSVVVGVKKTGAIGYDPFKYFRCALQFDLIQKPLVTYSLPEQIPDGALYFAGISNVRLPPALFQPQQVYGYDTILSENNSLYNIDKGNDYATVKFNLVSNESKMAAVINAIALTYRNAAFQVDTGDYNYMFGRDHDGSASYQVKLDTDEIKIVHENHNEFSAELTLTRIS